MAEYAPDVNPAAFAFTQEHAPFTPPESRIGYLDYTKVAEKYGLKNVPAPRQAPVWAAAVTDLQKAFADSGKPVPPDLALIAKSCWKQSETETVFRTLMMLNPNAAFLALDDTPGILMDLAELMEVRYDSTKKARKRNKTTLATSTT